MDGIHCLARIKSVDLTEDDSDIEIIDEVRVVAGNVQAHEFNDFREDQGSADQANGAERKSFGKCTDNVATQVHQNTTEPVKPKSKLTFTTKEMRCKLCSKVLNSHEDTMAHVLADHQHLDVHRCPNRNCDFVTKSPEEYETHKREKHPLKRMAIFRGMSFHSSSEPKTKKRRSTNLHTFRH
jgi:hypothetical protein